MSEAHAKLDLRFTKRVTIKQGTLTDLKNRFSLNNDSIEEATSNPSPISIDSVTLVEDGAIVRLAIPILNGTSGEHQIPQPGNVISVSYSGGEGNGALVDSSTGYAISDLVAVKTQNINGYHSHFFFVT